MNSASKQDNVVVRSKTEYSYLQKIVCCRCFSCLQQQKTLTSDIRKETMQRMIEDYKLQDDEKILMDPVKLMILIYVCNEDSVPSKHIQRCKVNPSTGVINYRTDLEFYIPQVCNYLVFHRNLKPNYLLDAVERMSKLNFYFAHLYYFYMKSIQKNITKQEIQLLKPVSDYNLKLLQKLNAHYKGVRMIANDLYAPNIRVIEEQVDSIDFGQKKQVHSDQYIQNIINQYETTKFQYGKLTKVNAGDVILNKYSSIFQGKDRKTFSFSSTISFFEDLFYMCADLVNHKNKKQKAIQYIKMINQHLPAAVYIPFSKNSYRLCNVLKIVTSQTKVFSTKQRSPVCICIETYCPSENLPDKEEENFWINVQTPITLKMTSFQQRNQYFVRHFQQTAQFRKSRLTNLTASLPKNIMEEQRGLDENNFCQMSFRQNKNIIKLKEYKKGDEIELRQTVKQQFSVSLETEVNSIKKQQRGNSSQVESERSRQKSFVKIRQYNTNTKKYYEKGFQKMFGQRVKSTKADLANNSIFGNFRSWDVTWIIIKTHDDLKQQQFAMQLIQQFSYIFKLQKLPLNLTIYEVLSMGPDRGIIQMVKDSVTFDTLKRTLKKQFPSAVTLRDFFQIYFSEDIVEAKQTFLQSLVAYCLVTYIIQVKDRHNGNILLHRSGRIFHIDFGFFLSNSPGKGIELERDCPFKFLSQYIEVLDGVDSIYFKKFRQYFFLGFKAIKKHQNKILMLVKMMYSSSGATMPCFSKGELAIKNLQDRINPPLMANDAALNEHCQQLINRSLDNWASKWYDRFQYWAQGIFY